MIVQLITINPRWTGLSQYSITTFKIMEYDTDTALCTILVIKVWRLIMTRVIVFACASKNHVGGTRCFGKTRRMAASSATNRSINLFRHDNEGIVKKNNDPRVPALPSTCSCPIRSSPFHPLMRYGRRVSRNIEPKSQIIHTGATWPLISLIMFTCCRVHRGASSFSAVSQMILTARTTNAWNFHQWR